MVDLAKFVVQTHAIPAIKPGAPATIAEVAALIDQPLPLCYWWFLRCFGRSSTWAWFDGDDASLRGIHAARRVARAIAADGPVPWLREPQIMPFTQHDGYVVYFVHLDAGDDPPVFVYVLGDDPPAEKPTYQAPSFSAWLREQALAHVERQRWLNPYLADVTTHPNGWGVRQAELNAYWADLHEQRRQLIAEIHAADVVRRAITGPLAFQQTWMQRFRTTDLHQRMVADRAYIPFGWTPLGDRTPLRRWSRKPGFFTPVHARRRTGYDSSNKTG
jgi:hypothetical protein